jgi:L-2,4-diaminobutyrate decarboxylase
MSNKKESKTTPATPAMRGKNQISSIARAYDGSRFRELGHSVVDVVADYLDTAHQSKSAYVLPNIAPDAQVKFWSARFRPDGNQEPIALLEDMLQRSISLQDPRYLGHQNPATIPLTALCDMVDSILNNPTALYEMGPASTAIENVVIRWMAQHMGYGDQSGGVLTSGATLANLTALLTARQVKGGDDAWKNGTANQQLGVMLSSQAHYSISRAVHIMGWGDDGTIPVSVDEHFKLRVNELETLYRRATERGIRIIALIGNACSTATGVYDPLDRLAEFAEQHNLWFHVDGAHGASALLSERYRSLLNGIERADSVVWDAHKMLLMPGLVTGLIYKDHQHSYQTFSQRAGYLFRSESQKEWYNLGQRTFECTKKAIALKAYIALSVYGEKLFSEFIEHSYGLAREFAALIKGADDFELAVEPESNIVCFRYKGPGSGDLDALQERIRQSIVRKGDYYFLTTQLPGGTYLRCVFMNPLTQLQHLESLLTDIRNYGNETH